MSQKSISVAERRLMSGLDKQFRGQERVALGKITRRIQYGAVIPSGTFAVMASGDTKLRVKILEAGVAHKNWSVPFPLDDKAARLSITPHYLLWFFSRDFVREYLVNYATGTVILRIPRNLLESLPIPIPKGAANRARTDEVVLEKPKSAFGVQLAAFHEDYTFNVEHKRYHTAIILAGAMAEMILYQSLIDQDVDKKVLEDDHNLGLGKMLTYLKLLKLDGDVPFSDLRELQQKRNAAIHAGLLAKTSDRFGQKDLKCFDHIVRHYGI